jgi:hypothetical protein
MIIYSEDGDIWEAMIWIEREVYIGMGQSKEKAKIALLEHLKGIRPIYLEQIRNAQEIIGKIEELIHESV